MAVFHSPSISRPAQPLWRQRYLLCLQQRMRWYGHDCRIKNIHLGDSLDYSGLDMLFMGGGSDREQGLVYQDLVKRSTAC